jgi:uncharacterized protein with FMN-binding domain
MKKFVAALVSAAAGVGVVLGLHGSRPSHPLASAAGSRHDVTSRAAGSKKDSSSAGSEGALRSGEALGTRKNYGYGILAVEVTARSGRITDLTTVGLQIAEPFSQQLAEKAIPILRAEVLRAQSANVAVVSGATYTSDAYLFSIQAALDHLRS